MDKKKVKEFVKTHKKEIALTALAVIGGTVVFAITKKKPKIRSTTVNGVFNEITDLAKPELGFGTITELWKEGDYTNAIVNDITVADLGRFGDELCKIEGIKPETIVTSVMGFIGEVEA